MTWDAGPRATRRLAPPVTNRQRPSRPFSWDDATRCSGLAFASTARMTLTLTGLLILLVIAGICGGLGAAKLRPSSPHFPSLASRLRVAIKSNPLEPNQIEAARDTAASILLTPSVPPSGRRARRSRPARNNRNMQAGLILMATLLGWAATRRRSQARQADV